MTTISFSARGIPIPHIYTLHSYTLNEIEGRVHFTGWYPIEEAREPTGTELDNYEYLFTLPKTMSMTVTEYVKDSDLHTRLTYEVEIYERVVIVNPNDTETLGLEQVLYFRILSRIYSPNAQ